MSALEVGNKLVALCREGKNLEAIETLYSPDIVSVEAAEGGGFPRTMNGIAAVKGKGQWWEANHEVHSAEILGPYVHGDDRFAVIFRFDITSKPMNNTRMQMDEVGVYTVTDGKVSREEFFYTMG
jgi:ketosteroid isomerase-like protein